MSRFPAPLCCAVFFFVAAGTAQAQICRAPSLSEMAAAHRWDGIGDGCSLKYTWQGFTFNLAQIPSIGLFRSTFTPACDAHDRCYVTIGASAVECDNAFLSNMRSACSHRYSWFWQPVEYTVCNAAALDYYSGVRAFSSSIQNPTTGFQQDVLAAESPQMGGGVLNDACGTTPERTGLYDASVVASVNAAYVAAHGRSATPYEFFAAVNTGNLLSDRAAWEAQVALLAQNSPSVVPPIGYEVDLAGGLLTASPLVAGAEYLWRVNGQTSEVGSIPFYVDRPLFDTTYRVEGFVRVDQKNGQRNMAIIDRNIRVAGECSSSPGNPCY
jgi:hypothetical protein